MQPGSQCLKTIIEMTPEEAFRYLYKTENYIRMDVPHFIKDIFDTSLKFMESKIGNHTLEDIIKEYPMNKIEDLNVEIKIAKAVPQKKANTDNLQNLDIQNIINNPQQPNQNNQNNSTVNTRKILFPHPALFFLLNKEITQPNNWERIVNCFKIFMLAYPLIEVASLPVIKILPNRLPAEVLSYYQNYNLRIIGLSTEYNNIIITDIKNCYPSIKLSLLEDALCLKNTPYENLQNKELSKRIIQLIKLIQNGEEGIPIGSLVFDFISEIILSYSDLLLDLEIKKRLINNSLDYKI
ncbi:MAG: hypothetical protein MJ252_16450, partial [archaeon]|nr:hypothetical protein [archaeon]